MNFCISVLKFVSWWSGKFSHANFCYHMITLATCNTSIIQVAFNAPVAILCTCSALGWWLIFFFVVLEAECIWWTISIFDNIVVAWPTISPEGHANAVVTHHIQYILTQWLWYNHCWIWRRSRGIHFWFWWPRIYF